MILTIKKFYSKYHLPVSVYNRGAECFLCDMKTDFILLDTFHAWHFLTTLSTLNIVGRMQLPTLGDAK